MFAGVTPVFWQWAFNRVIERLRAYSANIAQLPLTAITPLLVVKEEMSNTEVHTNAASAQPSEPEVSFDFFSL